MSGQDASQQQIHRSYIANYILAIAAILFLLTYPLQDRWWGAFLSHLSGAAFIGGLADWYAVTALFRRPLGISFKTALIPRSKERIAETARTMVENEILTVPNMYKVLKSHPVLDAGLDYLHSEKGFHSAEQVVGQMINTFMYTIDMDKIVQIGAGMGEKAVEKIRVAPVLSKAVKFGLVGEAGKDFLDFLICSLETMVKSGTVKTYLSDIYLESIRQYEKRNFVYALVVKAALASELFSANHVSTMLQHKFLEILDDAKNPDSEYRRKAIHFIWQQAEKLDSNEEWQEAVEQYKMKLYRYMSSQPDITESWQRFCQDPTRQRRLCFSAADYLVQKLESWKQSDIQTEQMNRSVLAMAAKELKRLQSWFGDVAERELMQYDSEVLAAKLEEKVWYDLQMIRVNGSLVGALLGAVIFLVMYGMKGGW